MSALAMPCGMWWKLPSLCAIECMTPRKAFAKAMPAIVAALAIFSRAFGFAVLLTAAS